METEKRREKRERGRGERETENRRQELLFSHSQFARSTYVREAPSFQGRFISSFSRFLSQCSLMCTGLCARVSLFAYRRVPFRVLYRLSPDIRSVVPSTRIPVYAHVYIYIYIHICPPAIGY